MIIPAAGTGQRLAKTERKAWVPLAGKPLISYALDAFRSHPQVNEILLVVHEDDMLRTAELLATAPTRVTEKAIIGGAERRDSVWQALQNITAGTDIVLIHDAARPFVSQAIIDNCLQAVQMHGAAIVACPVADTLKRADDEQAISATLTRAQTWGAQTPQGFRTALLQTAYRRAIDEDWVCTDDAEIVERSGHHVHLVKGDSLNFKITHPDDHALAERLLRGNSLAGFGYDVHRLVPERNLVLGGVKIDHPFGLLGHSDADVLTHAIMDALLGAATLGDIGQHFPDSNEEYRNISSIKLLRKVGELLARHGFMPLHIDATLAAEAPKIAAYLPIMRQQLADALALLPETVSIKATTTEGLGYVGEQKGMAAYATATITKNVAKELQGR